MIVRTKFKFILYPKCNEQAELHQKLGKIFHFCSTFKKIASLLKIIHQKVGFSASVGDDMKGIKYYGVYERQKLLNEQQSQQYPLPQASIYALAKHR